MIAAEGDGLGKSRGNLLRDWGPRYADRSLRYSWFSNRVHEFGRAQWFFIKLGDWIAPSAAASSKPELIVLPLHPTLQGVNVTRL
jgi:hypothetical protein